MQQQDWTKFSLQRPNYFPGQYLLDEDFELAHKYLSDRQRYINSRLHLAGIVEGLEVEVIAGEAEITIKSGTAIDGEGNLIILSAEKSNIKITSGCWVCLRYHQEQKTLQEAEIPESFTRFAEEPLLTLLEGIEAKDSKTVTLAKLSLENGQVKIDNSVRQYSGVRLPSGQSEEIALQSDGKSLTIKGNLSISGILQLGESEISGVSKSIDTERDRTDVVPSEKAVKDHINKRIIAERLAAFNAPTEEGPAISLSTRPDGKIYGWKTAGGEASDPTSVLKLLSYQEGDERPRLTIQRHTGNVGIGTITPERTLDVEGVIRAKHIESTNPMRHRMYPNDPIVVYQDIFDAVKAGAIVKYGRMQNYDDTSHNTDQKLWNDRRLIRFGQKESDAGALIIVPDRYDTVWVRVRGDESYNFKAQFRDKDKEDLGYWTTQNRYGNPYCPDGSLSDGYHRAHQWLPIPVGRSGEISLMDKIGNPSAGGLWLSGLGFSKNPWAHATQSALGYHWAVNTGAPIQWETHEWNSDILAHISRGNKEMMVPYVWSGRDKLLYIVEQNSNWNGCMHGGIMVNETPIERFLSTYDNPFARHWNSKSHNRYIAARIPAELIPKPKSDTPPLLKVKINMMKQDEVIHFREMGTHDLELPYSL